MVQGIVACMHSLPGHIPLLDNKRGKEEEEEEKRKKGTLKIIRIPAIRSNHALPQVRVAEEEKEDL